MTERIDLNKRRLFGRPQVQFEPKPAAPRPPYAIAEAMFQRECDGCGKCVAVCEPNIIMIKDDLASIEVDYSSCLVCGTCQSACPSMALSNTKLQTGLIATVSNSCENIYSYCSNCEDSCSHGALEWQEDKAPQLTQESCIGCGQCLDSCYTSVISLKFQPSLRENA